MKQTLNRITCYSLLIWSSLVFSSFGSCAEEDQSPAERATEQDVRQGALDSEQLEQLALASEAREHEVVWLEVQYPEQEQTHNVLALEQKPRQPRPQGAVLILHDKEQHADWPFLVRPLRSSLPDSGWYTLSINLPYDEVRNIPARSLDPKLADQVVLDEALKQALAKPPVRTKQNEPLTKDAATEDANAEVADSAQAVAEPAIPDNEGAESDGTGTKKVDIDLAERKNIDKPAIPYRVRAQVHLNAAMDHLKRQGYQNIIILAYRSGADLALDYIKPRAAQIPKQGFALVIIDPILQYGYQTDLSKALGSGFRAPVLDVVNGADLEGRISAIEREAGARMARALGYQQIRLMANETGAFQQTLLRRIRAWLEKYAPGMSATKYTNN